MRIKQVKRKCGVRGCRNTDSFSISRTREMGNSVIICKQCLAEALEAVKYVKPLIKTIRSGITAPPSLFYNAEALGLTEKEPERSTEQAENESIKEQEKEGESTEYTCPKCGREFDSQRGLTVHLKTCKSTQ